MLLGVECFGLRGGAPTPHLRRAVYFVTGPLVLGKKIRGGEEEEEQGVPCSTVIFLVWCGNKKSPGPYSRRELRSPGIITSGKSATEARRLVSLAKGAFRNHTDGMWIAECKVGVLFVLRSVRSRGC